MRFHPNNDANFYYEITPSWNLYQYHPAPKSWKRVSNKPHTINYWRDLEGARMPLVRKEDVNFENWSKSRVRNGACLPLYNDGGHRFIAVQKDSPAGFKYRPRTLNLKEVLEMHKYEERLLRDIKRRQKREKMLNEKVLKENGKAKKGRIGKSELPGKRK